jgi:transcriptional regulator with GAF, ATPase, and Fis domain
VLLWGETGTGKEVVARAVHEASTRNGGPFVALNCAALPEALVESELFGHERGAFTGAVGREPGSFELAHRGTLFLDEVGDLPLDAQAKLLRVLQEREIRRIGATVSTPVDVRVIAASNRDLTTAIAEGAFRADLFYRLSVFPIRVPALRERAADIPQLARHFLDRFARRQGRRGMAFTPAALDRLAAYSWPGNVRELQNVVERALILSRGAEIDGTAVVLTPEVAAPAAAPVAGDAPGAAGPAWAALPAAEASAPQEAPVRTLAETDRAAILAALDAAAWRISGRGGAAERLGLKPTTLHAKMRKLGIRRPNPTDLSRQLRGQ